MSIIIKGAKMPECGWDCPYKQDVCFKGGTIDWEYSEDKTSVDFIHPARKENCPLVEVSDYEVEGLLMAREIMDEYEGENNNG